jgi:hypothetical protein
MSFGELQRAFLKLCCFPRHLGHTSALESVLLSVLSALEAEMVFIRNLVGGLLAELEDDIDRDKFKRLLHYSRKLASFQNRANLVRAKIATNDLVG